MSTIRDPGPAPDHLSDGKKRGWERERARLLEEAGAEAARDAATTAPLDANALDDESYRALLAARGISDPGEIGRAPPRKPTIDPRIAEMKRREAEVERQEREALLAEGVIDARTASPEVAARRLRQITGLDVSAGEFRPVKPPTPPPEHPEAARRDRLEKARASLHNKMWSAHNRGRALDARTLDADEYAIFIAERGLTGREWGE